MSEISKACCTTPPAVSENYQPRGKYSQIAGTNTYITGPAAATKAILMVFDIFGFCSQAIQGADILAHNTTSPFIVIIPDFFDGTSADPAWFSPNAASEDQAKLGAFFQGTAAPPRSLARIPAIVGEVTREKLVDEWGILGLCWGGKVATISAAEESGFKWKAAAQVHPAMLDAEDAKKIKIPFALLPSGDEKKEDCDQFGANLTGEKVLETFADMPHGWMGARGNLKDDRVRSEYERGYQIILDFFLKYL